MRILVPHQRNVGLTSKGTSECFAQKSMVAQQENPNWETDVIVVADLVIVAA
jgi:hypothetical protein